MLILRTFLSCTTIFIYSDRVDNFIVFFSSGLFVMSVLEGKYAKRTLLIYVLLVLLGLYSSVQVGNMGFLITLITCLSIRKENFDTIIKYVFRLELCLFLTVIVVSCFMSLIGVKSISSLIAGEMRFNFGFAHPNVFSMMLLSLIIMWTYINFEELHIKNLLAILLITIIAYYFTKTRTFLINIGCMISICVLIKTKKVRIKKILSMIARFAVPFFAGITYLLAVLFMYGNTIAIAIDNLLSYRIRLVAYGLSHYGVSLFGKNLSNNVVIFEQYWGLTSFTFDNIYSYFFTNIGIVWLIVISICFYFIAKKKDSKKCMLIILWSLYGMTEVHGINCYMFFPILICASLLKSKEENKNGQYYCTYF